MVSTGKVNTGTGVCVCVGGVLLGDLRTFNYNITLENLLLHISETRNRYIRYKC